MRGRPREFRVQRTSNRAYREVDRLYREYGARGAAIRRRLREFEDVGRRPEPDLFEELCFCLLAIQSKARACDAAVRELASRGLLLEGTERQIAAFLRRRVRFHNHKAAYIVRARERFFRKGSPGLGRTLGTLGPPPAARAWLVREVDGLGLKEASHFLRNIGRGHGLAILDRHILRNLVRHGVIARVPRSLTPRRYLEIEGRMRRFADTVGVPLAALDLLFWSRETGEIFK